MDGIVNIETYRNFVAKHFRKRPESAAPDQHKRRCGDVDTTDIAAVRAEEDRLDALENQEPERWDGLA